MRHALNTLSGWMGLGPMHTEPAQLEHAPLTMRRILEHNSRDFQALVSFILANPQYRLETEQRHPSRDDALKALYELPPRAKAAQKYLWGIWRGDELVGFVEVIRHWPQAHYLYIGQLMIGQRWQRLGHGRTVLRMLAERSGSWSGIRRWRLAVVASQSSALAFWKAMSFTDTGQRENMPGYLVPLVMMERMAPR
ncbi:GNAT family N-acetyltransferase [Piscinibacter terrae]|uniref:GNAT family N-acetyltransferase n=1 Tax=Piscinibacter terrae TaxID=2496871 RepID=A0A3N7HS34_9BURK|nr:GNAT family N-acetyltransferase [Albitalea terrae]RQP25070.1 GNAT family N-acetyltransferase [Albitalea terrae]